MRNNVMTKGGQDKAANRVIQRAACVVAPRTGNAEFRTNSVLHMRVLQRSGIEYAVSSGEAS